MEREAFLRKVRDHLQQTYQCHTIFLYGSYQTGDYSAESDIDLIGFSDHVETQNKVETFQGKLLDVWIHHTEEMKDPGKFLKVHGGEVLLDVDQQAGAFLTQVDAVFKEGPPILAGREKAVSEGLVDKNEGTVRESRYGRTVSLSLDDQGQPGSLFRAQGDVVSRSEKIDFMVEAT